MCLCFSEHRLERGRSWAAVRGTGKKIVFYIHYLCCISSFYIALVPKKWEWQNINFFNVFFSLFFSYYKGHRRVGCRHTVARGGHLRDHRPQQEEEEHLATQRTKGEQGHHQHEGSHTHNYLRIFIHNNRPPGFPN